MVTGLNLESSIQNRIKELIEFKAIKAEAYFHTGESALLDFIRLNIELAESKELSLPAAKAKLTQLDAFFITILNDK